MRVNRALVRYWVVAVLAALPLVVSSAAQRPSSTAVASIRIDNFGKINDHYYRGAQPDDRDYGDLAALGIRTVIDLTRDGSAKERGLVEGVGMTFYRIPMTTSDWPSEAAVTQYLELVNDPANQPVYVHCQGGRHRTGVMTAVYRMTEDGWTADQAYAEMKHFDFEGFPGHPTLKTFVYDYYAQIERSHVTGNLRPAATTALVR
jgi:tyrosine-protein phosphatase SIW14